MEEKTKLISKCLDNIETSRDTLVEDVVAQICKNLDDAGFAAEEDEWSAKQTLLDELEEKGSNKTKEDFEYNFWDDDCVRECANEYESDCCHPWDWYRFGICSIECDGIEIFYVDYEID